MGQCQRGMVTLFDAANPTPTEGWEEKGGKECDLHTKKVIFVGNEEKCQPWISLFLARFRLRSPGANRKNVGYS